MDYRVPSVSLSESLPTRVLDFMLDNVLCAPLTYPMQSKHRTVRLLGLAVFPVWTIVFGFLLIIPMMVVMACDIVSDTWKGDV